MAKADSINSKEFETLNNTPQARSEKDFGNLTAGNPDIEEGTIVGDDPALDTEKQEVPPEITFPDGGLQAWLIVLGTAISMFCSFGYVNAFGVYESYYLTVILKDKTADDIAWIGSIQIAFIFGSGLFAGSIFDRYGARIIIIPASILLVTSIMLTSICKEYYQFLLCQGILGGLSQGALYTPAIGVIGQYFNKKRGAAMGLVVAGSSLGGVILPIMLANLLEKTTFGWTVRAIGFLFAGLLTITCFTVVERLPHRKGTFFLPEAFKNVTYSLLVAAFFFILWGLFTPFFFIPTYALNLGMSHSMSIYLVSILNGLSFPGRVLPGILADKLGRLNLMIVTPTITLLLIWCWLAIDSATGLIVLTAFFGFWSGSVISLFPAVMAQIVPNPREMGTYIGMAMGISGVAGLTGSPIAGALLTHYGYTAAIAFSGSCMAVGTFLLVIARLHYNRKIFVVV
ncbi:hypothetical protein TWF569_007268 [Orbilia oligospora]|uniref:Major facilitator superfamily (MFS) profile domain-containing protein n=1 Tax=Orbilia oligospora TaxID=2813651 RepID=A0A7C8J2S9_ORBOL|nr:hypothetical protein TWF706_010518 [Orbilia oligospora]KAF3090195.1 hypothetical protein TWF102_009411 [Orbilia oligospora]KAF3094368.1 hypothetical protein TWF103_010564 [Orbilia oligospora]KAF3141798.1 hypothetical protein TWF594_005857 [Orbilia oligospora]KAF3143649.1 hypothetical protein TWF569_007268 [Orbilia oligospora]